MTKLPEELHHILGEVAHPCPAFCGFGKLGSYVVGLIYSLASTERAFDFIPLSYGLGHQGLPLRAGWFLLWSSEWLAVVYDLEVFQYGSVGPVHIDFVCKDGCRQEAEPLLVLVNLELQVCALVIGIPAVMVDEVIPFHDAHANLCSKLHLCGGLATDDGAHVGLEDTDDAVFAGVLTATEHPVLLKVHLHRGIQYPFLILAQAVEAVTELSCRKVCQSENISVQAAEHLLDGFLHQTAALLLHLHQISVGVTSLTIICIGYGYACRLADTADETVHDAAAVIDDVHVNRIAYLCIGTRGIYLQYALVLASLAVSEGCCVLINGRSGRRFLSMFSGFVLFAFPFLLLHLLLALQKLLGHLVDVLIGDAFAQINKKGRVEYQLVGELLQTTEVLHVGILLYHLDGVNVRKTGRVLNEHGSYHHAGWLGTSTDSLIVELLTVLLLVLVPGEMVAQPHPPVALVLAVERRPETIDGQLLVSWLKSHLLVTFNTQRYSFFC